MHTHDSLKITSQEVNGNNMELEEITFEDQQKIDGGKRVFFTNVPGAPHNNWCEGGTVMCLSGPWAPTKGW